MRHVTVVAALGLTLVIGCGDGSTEPEYDYTAYVGTWTLTTDRSAECPDTLTFVVPVEDAGSADQSGAFAGTMNVSSDWYIGTESESPKQLTGHFDLAANTFDLVFWWSGHRAEFAGTVESSSRVAGTFTAPEGMFHGFSPCVSDATASK